MALKAHPHVALLIETTRASGRHILLYHEPQGVTEALPRWLRHWRRDGIIARIQTPTMAAQIAASGIPRSMCWGVVPNPRCPLRSG